MASGEPREYLQRLSVKEICKEPWMSRVGNFVGIGSSVPLDLSRKMGAQVPVSQ